MLLYVENKAYPLKTLVVLCQPTDTVARVRAQLLHSLYEIGHSNHQFRLRYKGTYMRDSYTLEEYKILSNAVIGMVPLNDISEWKKDMRFHQTEVKKEEKPDVEDLVQVALKSEIKFLDIREKILGIFKTMLLIQILLVLLSIFTVYWYFFFVYAIVLFLAFIYCPTFTRIGGWVGKNSVRRKEFMITFGVLTLLMMAAGVILFTLTIIDLKASAYPTTRCVDQAASCFASARDAIEEGVCMSYQKQCYEASIWTAVYFGLEILVMLGTSIFCWILFKNFKFEVGDRIEHYLVQTREIVQILDASRYGTTSEKRNAAFELATMAASGDDNKFLIVSEGGLDVLVSLGLSTDVTTQEYATEAIAECLAVPAIQDQFVAIGGMRMLTALLNTKNRRTLKEAITAISYIVEDSDDNKASVIADQGLDDLLHACKYANAFGRKSLAAIYLELADYDETRVILTYRTATTEGFLHLLRRSSDEETVRMVLQAMELLAIESPGVITSNESLMMQLLLFPKKSLDKQLQYIVAKLLLHYAEYMETCDTLASKENTTDALLYFAHASDARMQKVLANISLRISESWQFRTQLRDAGLPELLTYLQNVSTDRETWNMADKALNNIQNTNDECNVKNPDLKNPSGSTLSHQEEYHHSQQSDLRARQQTTLSSAADLPSTSAS